MFLVSVRYQSVYTLLMIGILVVAAAWSTGNPISHAQEEGQSQIGLTLVAEGLVAPVDLEADGTGRFFIVDRPGVIYAVDGMGGMVGEPFLDIRDRIVELNPEFDERGLLGMALHPDFANNGRFYLYYTAPPRPETPVGWTSTNIVSEFTVSADNPEAADPNSERVLLAMDHPQPNHNGGDIAFGPDGFLYIPTGDGGGGNDEGTGHTEGIGNGQDLSTLLGKMLRIDVDGGDPYGIPADNPFAADANAAPEIFAYGLRNPWRIDFDSSGNLYVADAGQELYEEVNLVTAGGNYGWRIKEGAHCFDPAMTTTPPTDCPNTGANGEPLVDPVLEFDHTVGIVGVGGELYEGSALPDLAGQFIFGIWTEGFAEPNGRLYAATPSTSGLWAFEELMLPGAESTGEEEEEDPVTGFYILSVESDSNNELYILTTVSAGLTGNTGKVWMLGPDGEAAPVMQEEAPAPAAAGGMLPLPSLTVDNQQLAADGTVTVGSVSSPGPGWVVIHADDQGYYGPVIGFTSIPAGDSQNVAVSIDAAGITQVLHAMLHFDNGAQGTYEFPGPDMPVTGSNGRVLNVPFVLVPDDPNQPITVTVAEAEWYIMMPAKLPAGTVVFSVHNRGAHLHAFEIEGEGIEEEVEVEPGQTATLEVELSPGTYEVYCPVGDHADFGMRLEIEVEEFMATGDQAEVPADEQTTAGDQETEPDAPVSLMLQNQVISQDGTVMIESVTADGPAWVVIHADDSGAPGVVIGWVQVPAGTSTNVPVSIQGANVTATLHAMLHIDAGTEGTYEFPGADTPATDAAGNMVTMPFTVSTGGETGGAMLDGATLVEERCTVCHSRERIDAADKDEAGWTETVDRMIGYGAQLNADERQAVIDYLVATH